MSKKLSAVNPYLRDPVVRKESLWVSAKTSSAVEGIRQPFFKDAPPTVNRSSATGRIGAKSGKPRRGK
jgi:hypothetical protein